MMPLWFDITALVVVSIAMLGIIIGWVGIFRDSLKLGTIGLGMMVIPIALFVILAMFAIPLLIR